MVLAVSASPVLYLHESGAEALPRMRREAEAQFIMARWGQFLWIEILWSAHFSLRICKKLALAVRESNDSRNLLEREICPVEYNKIYILKARHNIPYSSPYEYLIPAAPAIYGTHPYASPRVTYTAPNVASAPSVVNTPNVAYKPTMYAANPVANPVANPEPFLFGSGGMFGGGRNYLNNNIGGKVLTYWELFLNSSLYLFHFITIATELNLLITLLFVYRMELWGLRISHRKWKNGPND